MPHAHTQHANVQLATLRSAIIAHPLVPKLTTLRDWRIFMQHHVFAVWDFMSLLKRLQKDFTCQTIPWTPPAFPELARFINEIALVEESDAMGNEHLSHCEIYVRAMRECGADVRPFTAFLRALAQGAGIGHALETAGVPPSVRRFVNHTLSVAESSTTAEVCAAFLWGRENLIPDLFQPLLDMLERNADHVPCLRHYLKRHIAIDGEEHGPLAASMLEMARAREGYKPERLQARAAETLLQRRLLWDAIDAALSCG